MYPYLNTYVSKTDVLNCFAYAVWHKVIKIQMWVYFISDYSAAVHTNTLVHNKTQLRGFLVLVDVIIDFNWGLCWKYSSCWVTVKCSHTQ